jgi:hypothetical protein
VWHALDLLRPLQRRDRGVAQRDVAALLAVDRIAGAPVDCQVVRASDQPAGGVDFDLVGLDIGHSELRI